MAEQRQNNVALTDEEKEQRAKKRNRTIITVVSVVAAVLIVVIVLLLLLVKCEPEENVEPPVGHTHSYSSWVVVDEPTCTEEGLRERTCSCGEKETEEIAALGHTAGEAVKENEKAPTCTATGSYEEVVSCTVCEEEVSRKTVTMDALGHDYKGEVTDEALCLVPGEMTYTCTRCDDSYTETIDALGHSWGETKPGQAPTCTSAGYTSYQTCIRCGYSNRDTIPAAGHTWGDWQVTTPATCTEAGEETRTCSVCGETDKQETELAAHTPGTDYIADENGHWFACSLCGGKASVADHDYTGEVQNCTICGVTDSQYLSFTPLEDGSGYGVGQLATALAEPDYTNEENPYLSFPAFTDAVKLPDYYNEKPITELTGMTVNVTIETPGGSTTYPIPCESFNFNTTLKSIELSNFITEIPDQAFYECTALESIEVPDSVTTIDEYAFSGCAALVSIDISNVTSIGNSIFLNCTSLKSVTLPQGITTIVDSMFSGCTSLTTIEIPESVTMIEIWAFRGCTSLNSVIFADTTSTWSIREIFEEPLTITPSGDAQANAEMLATTYWEYEWTKQTND